MIIVHGRAGCFVARGRSKTGMPPSTLLSSNGYKIGQGYWDTFWRRKYLWQISMWTALHPICQRLTSWGYILHLWGWPNPECWATVQARVQPSREAVRWWCVTNVRATLKDLFSLSNVLLTVWPNDHGTLLVKPACVYSSFIHNCELTCDQAVCW